MAKTDGQSDLYSMLTRKLKGSDYGEAINTIQIDLGLLEKSGAEVEALLIYMVDRRYRKKNHNADVTLMALGLLDGYDNRTDRLEPLEERDLYAERREKFLKETQYIAIKYGDQAKTYKEAEQTLVKNQKTGEKFPLIKRIRNSLNSSTTGCIVTVLTALYKEKDAVNGHLDKAKKDFQQRALEKKINSINWSELDHIPPELLPSLKFYNQALDEVILTLSCDIVEEFDPKDEKGATKVTQEIVSKPTEMLESAPELTPEFTSESSAKSSQESTSEPFSNSTQGQPADAALEPASALVPKPTSDSVKEATHGLSPEPIQGPSEHLEKSVLSSSKKQDENVLSTVSATNASLSSEVFPEQDGESQNTEESIIQDPSNPNGSTPVLSAGNEVTSPREKVSQDKSDRNMPSQRRRIPNSLLRRFKSTGFWSFVHLVIILSFLAFVACLIHDQNETNKVNEIAGRYRTQAMGHHMFGGEFTVDCSPKDYSRSLLENSYHNLDPKLFADDSEHILGVLDPSEDD